MPSLPLVSDYHVNRLLTNFSVAFVQDATKFAHTAFSPVDVQNKSDLFATYDRGDFLRDELEHRGPGDTAVQLGYRLSNTSYNAEVWAGRKMVSDQERANVDAPFSLDQDAARFLSQKALIRREVDFAGRFFTTGVWGTDLTGTTDFVKWSDASSTPVSDVLTEAADIEAATGQLANVGVTNRAVWNKLREHPDVVDRVKHTSDEPVTEQIVARLMGLDRIIVGASVQNTAQEGAAATVSGILGNHFLLAYQPPSPSLYTPAAGYMFRWSGLEGMADGTRIKTYRVEERASDVHEIESAWDFKVVASALGTFFSTAI